MEDNYKVYCYVNKNNGKRYVGCTSMSLTDRAGRNAEGYRGSPKFYEAIILNGWQAFEPHILHSGLSKEAAADLEKYYTQQWDTINTGYNSHVGGYAVQDKSDEYRLERACKISETLKKQRSTDSYRKKMRDRMVAVWTDPVRSRKLRNRPRNGAGRKPCPVYCRETDTVYSSFADAARALDITKTALCSKFKRANNSDISIRFRSGKNKGVVFHFKKLVDVKESELLEA